MNSEHLLEWDIHITREKTPLYALSRGRLVQAPPRPFRVEVTAIFSDRDEAELFEYHVREILEDMT